MMKQWKTVAGCLGLAFLPALGGFISRPDEWYQSLEKPVGNPPSWVFGPVWTTLYTLMGLAHADFTLAKSEHNKSTGHKLYLSQLLLNGAWSPLFFGMRAPGAALADIVPMLALIGFTLREFGKVSPRAAKLLIPYLLWVAFATYLNFEIVRLNRQ